MPTLWHKWFILFVEANKLNAANNLAAQWDPAPGGDLTFGDVALSPTGHEPATHYAASTPATPTMRDGITTALGALAWANLYATADVQANPPLWTGPGGFDFAGNIYSAWIAACQHMGLQLIQPDLP
jgi:hypothetical protein